jgi:hypothetical protein
MQKLQKDELFKLGNIIQLRTAIWGGFTAFQTQLQQSGDTVNLRACIGFLRRLETLRTGAWHYIYLNSYDIGIEGIAFVPIDLCLSVHKHLLGIKEEFESNISFFLNSYVHFRKDVALKTTTFNPTVFPRADVISRKFKLKWIFFNLGFPNNYPEELTEMIQIGFNDLIDTVMENGITVLRNRFKMKLIHIIQRLSGPHQQRFNHSSLNNLFNFIESFPKFNIFQDKPLEVLVKQTQNLIVDLEAKDLRKDPVLRVSMVKELEKIKGLLTSLTENGNLLISN